MSPTRRRFIEFGGAAVVGSVTGTIATGTQDEGSNGNEEPEAEVTVRQDPENTFYWVLPGERRLSPHVFGTPESPRFGNELLEARVEQAKTLPEPLSDSIPGLLEELPFLVAAPEDARKEIDDPEEGGPREVLTEPTLYSDEAEVTSGEFEITYRDFQPYDTPGEPGATDDEIDLDAEFTDPAGNEYVLEFDHVVQPPIPSYQTGGGVMVDAWHHGVTGTGSPLMPKLYNYAACWGVGDVLVNGEVATTGGFRVIHMMTTQTVRDRQYRLALDEELPLPPDETIAGRIHHTHGVVLPIRPTPDGPVYDPVPTAMELPNGETQPFIHAMWEQEEIVDGPFGDWEFPEGDDDEQESEDEQRQDGDFRLLGEAQGWVGTAPDDVANETNPTIELEAGTEYSVIWENADGIQHNFAIEDENGEDLIATELVGQQGVTQAVTFTADQSMVEYYCQVHPGSMRGSIEITG